MGQVTIYLDADTENKARAAANAEGVSLSKWIAERIRGNARTEWPEFVGKLAGAWAELPTAEQIRKSKKKDVRRGRL
jgi:hypothetical protein